FPKFMVSLLKAWYGDAATKTNEWGFQWLPRIDKDYSQLPHFIRMAEGRVKGLFLFGQNPAGGAPNAGLNRAALRQLDWLVVRDWFEIESACFWYKGPEPPDPKTIKTEIFFMPAAAAAEKDGCFTNTQRLLQWHDKAVDPPDDCRSDTWFVYHLGKKLKADGSTACGCWIYCGVFPEENRNRARSRRRDPDNYTNPDWGFSWPHNRRMMYNRASADPSGKPWSERKKYVWWDEAQKKWT